MGLFSGAQRRAVIKETRRTLNAQLAPVAHYQVDAGEPALASALAAAEQGELHGVLQLLSDTREKAEWQRRQVLLDIVGHKASKQPAWAQLLAALQPVDHDSATLVARHWVSQLLALQENKNSDHTPALDTAVRSVELCCGSYGHDPVSWALGVECAVAAESPVLLDYCLHHGQCAESPHYGCAYQAALAYAPHIVGNNVHRSWEMAVASAAQATPGSLLILVPVRIARWGWLHATNVEDQRLQHSRIAIAISDAQKALLDFPPGLERSLLANELLHCAFQHDLNDRIFPLLVAVGADLVSTAYPGLAIEPTRYVEYLRTHALEYELAKAQEGR